MIDKKLYAKKTACVSTLGMVGNGVLCILKLLGGYLTHSDALISDGVHSASDILGNIIVISGLYLSSKENKHFKGENFERIASAIIGTFLLLTGIFIGLSAVLNIINRSFEDSQSPTLAALLIAGISVIIKEFLFRFTKHFAVKYNSVALRADACHHRSDVFSTVGAFIGTAFCQLGFPVMDSVASLCICLLITKSAVSILRDSVGEE